MPHKRAKRSVREAERKNRETDLAPTPLANEPIPKGIARVLGAEATRAAYRARRAEESGKSEKGNGKMAGDGKTSSKADGANGKNVQKEGIKPGETLGEYNRRVEDAHRPLVRAAMRHTIKEKQKGDKSASVKGAVKRKREEEEEEERPVKEFVKFSSSAPRQLHEVAMAPPVFTKRPRGATTTGSTVSMARRVVLEQERMRAVEMYRALKAAKNEL